MANTYTINATGIVPAASKNMLIINNQTGSGKTLNIYRIWCISSQTGAVTGNIATMAALRYANTSQTGTAGQYIPHSSAVTAANANPFTNVSVYTGATTITTPTGTPEQVFRFMFGTDEVSAGEITLEALRSIPSLAIVHDSGYGDQNIEPIALRANESLLLQCNSVGTYVGNVDFSVELTIT